MSERRRKTASTTIIVASFGVVAWFAASHSELFMRTVEGASTAGLVAFAVAHIIYVILNAEIWFTVIKEAEPDITRFSIYSSYGVSSTFWPLSALLGAAAQIWALKRISPEAHVGRAISSLAPVVWIKGAVAVIGVAVLFGHQSPVNAGVAVLLTCVFGVGLVLIERATRDKDFFRGLAVVRNPKRLFMVVLLVTGAFLVQVIRLTAALKASGVHTDVFSVVGVVISQGFAGVMPILAGVGSAAVAFAGSEAEAAAAVMICTGSAFVAGVFISMISVIWRRKRKAPVAC